MSEWITDRLPTEKDADDIGRVWVCWSDGTVVPMLINKFDVGLPWQPKEKKPQPYEPPKPKQDRKQWDSEGEKTLLVVSPVETHWVDGTIREVLAGDIDPDEALAMRERMEHVAERLEFWADNSGMDAPRAFAAKLRGER